MATNSEENQNEFDSLALYGFGGVNAVGGNKLVLIPFKTKGIMGQYVPENFGEGILLDFGTDFSTRGKYFLNFTSGYRKPMYLYDGMVLGELPEATGVLSNIYSPELARDTIAKMKRIGVAEPNVKFNIDKDCKIASVVLSHCHSDHTGQLPYLNSEISLITTPANEELLNSAVFRDDYLVTYGGQFYSSSKKSAEIDFDPDMGDKGLSNEEEREEYEKEMLDFHLKIEKDRRRVQIIPPESPTKIHGFEITPFYVEHSLLGASAYLISWNGIHIVYSGDFRDTENFIQNLQTISQERLGGAPIDYLICEFTNYNQAIYNSSKIETINKIPVKNEAEIVTGATSILEEGEKQEKQIQFFSYKDLDIYRLISFFRIAKTTGRILVLPLRGFNVLYQTILREHPHLRNLFLSLLHESGFPINDEFTIHEFFTASGKCTSLPTIKCFLPPRGDGKRDDESLAQSYLRSSKKQYFHYDFIKYREDAFTVLSKENKKNKYLVGIDPFSFSDIADFIHCSEDPGHPEKSPIAGSVLIWSQHMPHDKSGDYQWAITQKWVDLFRFNLYAAHQSGHVSADDFKTILDCKLFKKIIPIHKSGPIKDLNNDKFLTLLNSGPLQLKPGGG